MDAGALQYGADRTAGDHTGTGSSRTQHDNACSSFALHLVRDGAADARDAEEGLLGLFHALGDRCRDFLGLAVAHADHAVAVADDYQGGEAEAAAALDDLGHAVDGDDALEELVLLGIACIVAATSAATTVATAAAVATFATTRRRGGRRWPRSSSGLSGSPRQRSQLLQSPECPFRCCSRSQCQPTFTCAVSDGGDAAVVLVAAAVEDHSFNTGSLGTLGDELADALGLGRLVAVEGPQVGFHGGSGSHGHALGVIDNLDEDVACGTVDDQARTDRGTGDALADAQVAAAA